MTFMPKAAGGNPNSELDSVIWKSGRPVVYEALSIPSRESNPPYRHTATNPRLCDQIQTNAGRTQMYVGRIPYILFQRLRLRGPDSHSANANRRAHRLSVCNRSRGNGYSSTILSDDGW